MNFGASVGDLRPNGDYGSSNVNLPSSTEVYVIRSIGLLSSAPVPGVGIQMGIRRRIY